MTSDAGVRLTINGEPAQALPVIIQRQRIIHRSFGNTWELANLGENGVPKSSGFNAIRFVGRTSEEKLSGQDLMWIESERNPLGCIETADQQTCSYQENAGQCDLGGHQYGLRPIFRYSARTAASSFLFKHQTELRF